VLCQHVGEVATRAVASHREALVATELREMRGDPLRGRDSVFDCRREGRRRGEVVVHRHHNGTTTSSVLATGTSWPD